MTLIRRFLVAFEQTAVCVLWPWPCRAHTGRTWGKADLSPGILPSCDCMAGVCVCVWAPAHRRVMSRYLSETYDQQTGAPNWCLQRSGTIWSQRKKTLNNRVTFCPRYQLAARSSLSKYSTLPSLRRKEGKVAYRRTHQIWRGEAAQREKSNMWTEMRSRWTLNILITVKTKTFSDMIIHQAWKKELEMSNFPF